MVMMLRGTGVLNDMVAICGDAALLTRALAELHAVHTAALALVPKVRCACAALDKLLLQR